MSVLLALAVLVVVAHRLNRRWPREDRVSPAWLRSHRPDEEPESLRHLRIDGRGESPHGAYAREGIER